MRWYIIGDSFVEGVAAPVGNGWAQRFAREIGSELVRVDGVGGRCSGDVVRLLAAEPAERFDELIVEVGINDSRLRKSSGGHETAPAQFKSHLEAIIERALQCGARNVHFVGLTGVDENQTDPFKPDKIYLNNAIRQFDQIIRDVCGGSPVSSYIQVPILSDRSELLADGLHPSASGHTELYAAISRHLCVNDTK